MHTHTRTVHSIDHPPPRGGFRRRAPRLLSRTLALSLALGLGLVVGTVSGCGDSAREADFIFVALDEHNTLDPQKVSWLHDGRIVESLFEGLTRYDPQTLELRPAVAERWDVSDDRRRYRFHLRDDARWSNGDPVTAGDFVYAWRRAMTPDTAADYTKLMFHIEGARAFFDWRSEHLQAKKPAIDRAFGQRVGLRAVDERTLEVTLIRPTPYFLELCAFVTFMPVHRESVEAATRRDPDSGMRRLEGDYFSNPDKLISNGPYTLDRRRFKRDLRMVANPEYFDRERMKNRSVLERVIPDPQTALLAYRNDRVDWFPVPSSSTLAADLVQQNRPDVSTVEANGVYFYNFNCQPTRPDGTDNPLADPRVRRALSMAIDREAIVTNVTRLNQPTCRTFIPPGVLPGYQSPLEAGLPFDPDAARDLLEDAGYGPDRPLEGLTILYNTGFGHEKIAQAVKRMWSRRLGVEVGLEGVEVKTFSKRLKNQEFSIARASWFGDYRDPTTWLEKMRTGDGNNDCAWSDPQYDTLLDQALEQAEPERRMAILQKAEARLLQSAPMAFVFQYFTVNLADPERVRGLHHNAWNKMRLEQVAVTPPSP